MDFYTHEPLDLNQPSIRHLCLLKGDYGPIHCLIYQDHLGDTAIPYEALSYVWGSSQLTHTIFVNGKQMRITENLFHALRQLRSDENDRILWVDAVCIDQQNPRERGHQVQQMSEIYRRAQPVLFWLGDSDRDTDAVISMLQKLKDKMEGPGGLYSGWRPTDQHELADEWVDRWLKDCKALAGHVIRQNSLDEAVLARGLGLLLKRSWFRRVWILQEVSNAQTGFVCCGKMSVSAMYFAQSPSFIQASPDPHCQAVLEIMPGPAHKISWSNERLNLLSLLKRFGTSEATDPRDIIFALRGVPAEAARIEFPNVDYEITEEELVCQAFKSMFSMPTPSWATTNTVADLVMQLDRFLAADIIASPPTTPLKYSEVRITENLLREMIDLDGRNVIMKSPLSWRCADQAAVLHAYRSVHLELATFLFNTKEEPIPWHRLVYSALQNPTGAGGELIDSLFADARLRKEHASVAIQMLYQLFPSWFNRRPKNEELIEENFDSSHVSANGLTALLDLIIKSGRKPPVDSSWSDSSSISLLYIAVRDRKLRVFHRLVSCGSGGLKKFEISRLRQTGTFSGRGTSAHQSTVAQIIAILLRKVLNDPEDFPDTPGNA
ncbi:hypothetical protein CcaCcLH18_02950 [Colletotrichum camelliae]|nr:hypothetical protein CcaCcLH18_02950 [Colletotrichum camelliae]